MQMIRVLDKSEKDRWDRFVQHHPLGSIYHTSDWSCVIESSYGHRAHYVVLEDEGEISAGIPMYLIRSPFNKRLVTVPCAQVCDPLVQTRSEYDLLLNFITGSFASYNASTYELKASSSFCRDLGLTVHDEAYCTFELNLDRSLDHIFSTFHKSCIQKQINKAEKGGLQLTYGAGAQDARLFYDLYLQMRKKNGLLPQPYRFFFDLWRFLGRKGQVEVRHAFLGDRAIGSIMLLKFKDRMIYEYGANDPDAAHHHPSHFLLWSAIRDAHAGNFRVFDFGRTSLSNTGLMTYKERWGAKPVSFNYQHFPPLNGSSNLQGSGTAKKLMKLVVSKSPPVVCEKLGNIIYKLVV